MIIGVSVGLVVAALITSILALLSSAVLTFLGIKARSSTVPVEPAGPSTVPPVGPVPPPGPVPVEPGGPSTVPPPGRVPVEPAGPTTVAPAPLVDIVGWSTNHAVDRRDLVFDLVPARPVGARLVSPSADGGWAPGDAAAVPDPVLGAALRVGAGGELSVSFGNRLQPSTASTLSLWVRWEPAAASQNSGAADPSDPSEVDDPPPAMAVRLSRGGDRLTNIDVSIGDEKMLSTTVDLDTPSVSPESAPNPESDPGAWHHIAIVWGGEDSTIELVVDGVVAASQPADTKFVPFRDVPRVVVSCVDEQRALCVGPTRFRARTLDVAELHRERHRDLIDHPSVDERNPLAFRIADDLDDPHLYITDDDIAGRPLHLVISNRSAFPVELPVWTMGEQPSAYLEFRFRPGCLVGGAHHWIAPNHAGWRVESAPWDDGGTSLFVGRLEPLTLAPGQSTAVTFDHVRASGELGAHGTSVELVYPHPHHPELLSSRVQTARVIGRRGRRRSPLRFGVNGDRTVLNNGDENRIELYIANTSNTRPIALSASVAGRASTLTLSMDAGEVEDAWALATKDQLLGTEVLVLDHPDWHIDVDTQGESPRWTLTPIHDQVINPGDRLVIVLDRLVTRLPAGRTAVHLAVENVAGYWDDEWSIELEKSTSRRNGFDPALEVHGDLRFTGSLNDRFGELLPPGVILMWHGSEDDIPKGWTLCDGNNRTPDLQGRFVRSPAPNDSKRHGGQDHITLSVDHLPSHGHTSDGEHGAALALAVRRSDQCGWSRFGGPRRRARVTSCRVQGPGRE